MKKKIEVEIDVPEGWEVEKVVEHYEPEYARRESRIKSFTDSSEKRGACYVTAILRPAFDIKAWWPEWLKAPFICMDGTGYWYAHDSEPKPSNINEYWYGGRSGLLSAEFFAFTPPPHITDWRQSLLENPHKATNQ